jgi:hypothetical protein
MPHERDTRDELEEVVRPPAVAKAPEPSASHVEGWTDALAREVREGKKPDGEAHATQDEQELAPKLDQVPIR